MPKEDLSGRKLDHVSLAGADLTEANLSQTSLRCAHLEGAKLEKATLTESDLHGAYLTQADLTAADLRRADLTAADLRGVDLGRVAALDGARLDGAKGVPAEVAKQAARTADRVLGVDWVEEAPPRDDPVEDEARVLFVARALARAGGFHDGDWDHTLTEAERRVYLRDARAAIAADRAYVPGADGRNRRRRPALERSARTQPREPDLPPSVATRPGAADSLTEEERA
jgi:uncharacterized protein YjbI with pentapeptide repeats